MCCLAKGLHHLHVVRILLVIMIVAVKLLVAFVFGRRVRGDVLAEASNAPSVIIVVNQSEVSMSLLGLT